ncbi:hypothetical protein Tsubulata_006922 [Turnera subulata]|uniref:Uncharacterized protein n=1 Tax=Turnera subulata TaxID=218843 RepID=A0A9Q0GG32_9ROSI|nr:hypothetical protein Tsubulata_006922 [Turnera subulata]
MNLHHLLYQKIPALQPRWDLEDTRISFFKCLKWQVEDTLDPINCPYHYFCDSSYAGNYPAYVDILVLLVASASYLTTLAFAVIDMCRRGQTSRSKRYFLPSGPIFLPLILLALAKGSRINTLFPVSHIGPAILLLLQASSLTFDNGVDNDVRYALFETSTVSGILHASMYLDSVILPYYTGFDALVSSAFSGECPSCVCRREVLVVGGRLIAYRGWSVTTFVVVGALCLRVVGRMSEEHRSTVTQVKSLLETLGWILITMDCVYLVRYCPEQTVSQVAAYVGILVLICLHLVKKVSIRITRWHLEYEKLER